MNEASTTATPGWSARVRFTRRGLGWSVIAFLLTLVFLALTLWVTRSSMEESVIDATQAANNSITRAFINENWAQVKALLPDENASPEAVRQSAQYRQIDNLVRRFSNGTDVLKIKIYNVAGRTVYSTDPQQIGEDAAKNRFFIAALGGKSQSQLTYRGRFDALEGHIYDRDLIASYIPVTIAGVTEGVVELYADRTFAIAEARRALLKLALIVAPVYLGVFFALLLLSAMYFSLQHRKESELRHMARREEAANQAKSQFLANMSHELRTPLNTILGRAQLLGEQMAESPPGPGAFIAVREHAAQIVSAGWHLLSLIEEVLDLSKIESGALEVELQPIDAQQLVRECLEQIQPLAVARQVVLALPPAGDGATQWVEADSVKLRQVLLNLLSNAVKYNNPGGSVSVAVHRTGQDRIAIDVADTGWGMTPEQVAVLFQPFTRFVPKGNVIEGTGIGLALSRRLAEVMRGTLDVRSEHGRGSVFTLMLCAAAAPRPDAASAQAAARPAPQAAVTALPAQEGPPLRVLYAEDTRTNFDVVRLYLEKQGMQVANAEDGFQALEMAARDKPDVILLDMSMPGLDGMQVRARLAANPATAAIPVVALSAGAMSSDIDAAMKAGFADYLTKPVRFPRLRETLIRLTAQR